MSILVLGLDGATWRNLRPWINEGHLPNLEELLERGQAGTLQSTIPCTTIPAVPSLITGKDPLGLELFGFTQPDGTVIDAHDIESPTVWDAIGSDHRSLIANLRSTYPPYELTGTMISGDLFLPADADDYVYPSSQQDSLSDFHVTEHIRRWDEMAQDPESNRKELLDLAEKQVLRKWEHFKRLWQEGNYDFGLFWIGKTDSIQHHFWHQQEIILNYYQFVDDIVGEYLNELDAADRILLSDHGFGQVPSRRFHVNTWLQQQGHLNVVGGNFGRLAVNFGQETLTRYVPKSLLQSMYDMMTSQASSDSTEVSDAVLRSDFDNLPGVNWSSTDAYLSFPWGISAPEISSETLESIIDDLVTLRDEEGDQVIQDAWKRSQVFSGERLNEVPEIVFLTSEKYRAVPQLSRSLFTQRPTERKIENQPVTGEHNSMRDGILVIDGEHFSETADEPIVNITEFAPTLVHLLNSPVPSSMEGDVRTDLLTTECPVEKVNWEHVERTPDTRSASDEKEVKERLENLGYLDE